MIRNCNKIIFLCLVIINTLHWYWCFSTIELWLNLFGKRSPKPFCIVVPVFDIILVNSFAKMKFSHLVLQTAIAPFFIGSVYTKLRQGEIIKMKDVRHERKVSCYCRTVDFEYIFLIVPSKLEWLQTIKLMLRWKCTWHYHQII